VLALTCEGPNTFKIDQSWNGVGKIKVKERKEKKTYSSDPVVPMPVYLQDIGWLITRMQVWMSEYKVFVHWKILAK
jgi:hypothetical protein